MFLSLAAWRSHIPLFPSKCKLSGGGSPQPASLALVLKAIYWIHKKPEIITHCKAKRLITESNHPIK